MHLNIVDVSFFLPFLTDYLFYDNLSEHKYSKVYMIINYM